MAGCVATPKKGWVLRVVKAALVDDWSELMRNEELNPWMMAKVKESYNQARQEDDQRQSTVKTVMQKSTGFLRRIIAPVEGHLVTLTGAR